MKREKMTGGDWFIILAVLLVVSLATLPFYRIRLEAMAEKADNAYEKAAYTAGYLLRYAGITEDFVRYYDTDSGKLIEDCPELCDYGCGTAFGDSDAENKGKFIRLEQTDEAFSLSWVTEIDEPEEEDANE